jgi:hypothetical protein
VNSPPAPAGPLYNAQNANNNNNNGVAPDPAREYIEWSQTHIQNVLQPVFYVVNKGDFPGLPGDPLVHVGSQVVQKVFDPAHPGLPSSWTPEQKAAVEQYRKQKAEEQKNRAKSAPRTPTRAPTRSPRGGAGAPGGAGGVFAARDNDRPILLAQLPNQPLRRPPGFEQPEDMGDGGGGVGGVGSIQQQNNEALNKLTASLPKDRLVNLNPGDPTGFMTQLQQLGLDGVDVIAYDESGEPGKTYRYKLRYHMLNPVYGSPQLVKNPKAADKFNVVSVASDWTNAIDIPASVSFFLASAPPSTDTVKLDLFKWQSGTVNKWTQSVSPGDRIGLKVTQSVPVIGPDGRPDPAAAGAGGAPAGNPGLPGPGAGGPGGAAGAQAFAMQKVDVDYTTPWTVVDVRNAGNEKYVILRDDTGNTVKREFRADQSSPAYKELREQVPTGTPVAEAGNVLR